jgi:glycosyltransferase involved in cell wall biosynthesis
MNGALRVLMLGPGLEVQGGVSAVERMLLAALPADIAATHVPTMVEGSKTRKLFTFLNALFTATRVERPDIVHIHFASRASSVRKMSLARLALARGCKVILHAHGGGYPDYWKSLSAPARRATAAVLRQADALIVLGERWREFFISVGVAPERIAVLPNPVALPPRVPRRAPGERTLFAYLGLIAGHKGSFDLVDAVARLAPATRKRLRVVMAGNGARAELERRVALHGLEDCFEVHGWLGAAERDALLAAAEVFVLPSDHEGLPMSLLEAMAWGLAPLCTPVGAIPELVQHEANGLLTPPHDPGALAAGIERLALDPVLRARLGAAARERVEPFAIEHYAPRLCALYDRVARLH